MMPGCGRSWDVRCVDAPSKNRALLLRKNISGYWRNILQSLLQDPFFHSEKEHLSKKWELPEFPLWEFVWLLALELSEGGLPREREALVSGTGWKPAGMIWKRMKQWFCRTGRLGQVQVGGNGSRAAILQLAKGRCDKCTGRQRWGSSLLLRGEKSKCSLNWGIKHLSTPTSNLH